MNKSGSLAITLLLAALPLSLVTGCNKPAETTSASAAPASAPPPVPPAQAKQYISAVQNQSPSDRAAYIKSNPDVANRIMNGNDQKAKQDLMRLMGR